MKTLQADIIQRFMSEKNFALFIQEYKQNRKRNFRTRSVTDTDKKILIDWKKGLMINELVKKYKKSDYSIKTSIVIASR